MANVARFRAGQIAEYFPSVHTPDFVSDPDAVINPPSLASVLSVPLKYWKRVSDDVAEMTAGEKTAQDAALQAAADAATAAALLTTSRLIGSIRAVRLANNLTNSTNVLADVPDLTFQLAPNSHYAFSFAGAYSTALAATGLQLAVNGPASPNLVRAIGQIAMTATTVQYGAVGAYDALIAATASAGATALPFWVEGNISTGPTGGAFTLRVRSETNGSAVTLLSGSYGLLYGLS